MSVIIPAYNPGAFLREAVDSVIAQEPAPAEILVVDDGSTEPLDLPDRPLVRVIRQPNMGVSAARNRGVAEARAELLAFLDADDVWYPGYRGMFRCAARDLAPRRAGRLRSLPRTGEIYGTQAFDRFRLSRRPSDLVWATAPWPSYVLHQVRRQVRPRSALRL